VTGGRTRQESVECGLTAVLDHIDVVLVHDAARCLAPPELYDAVAAEVVNGHDAVVPGIPVIDTLKRIDMNRTVIETPPRSEFMAVQTPQGFRRPLLIRAYLAALDRGDNAAPDDASLVESLGVPVQIVPGHEDAFKITRPRDLLLAESVLARQAAAT
jgi:2-C-methyl-D-erythritol 4-phosphate cytidylyltransferase